MNPWFLAWVSIVGGGLLLGVVLFVVALERERRLRVRWERRRRRRPGYITIPPYDHEGKP